MVRKAWNFNAFHVYHWRWVAVRLQHSLPCILERTGNADSLRHVQVYALTETARVVRSCSGAVRIGRYAGMSWVPVLISTHFQRLFLVFLRAPLLNVVIFLF